MRERLPTIKDRLSRPKPFGMSAALGTGKVSPAYHLLLAPKNHAQDYSILQHTITYYSKLQHITTYHSILQHTTMQHSKLQHII